VKHIHTQSNTDTLSHTQTQSQTHAPIHSDRRTDTHLDTHTFRQAVIVVQEVEESFSNQTVASSIPCRSVLEQDTEPLIAPDVQCAISVNVKCVYILVSRFG